MFEEGVHEGVHVEGAKRPTSSYRPHLPLINMARFGLSALAWSVSLVRATARLPLRARSFSTLRFWLWRAFGDRQRLRAWHGQRLRFLQEFVSSAWRVPPSAGRDGRAALLKTVDHIRSEWWGGYDTRDDDWGPHASLDNFLPPRDRA